MKFSNSPHRLLDAGKETSPSLCYLARPLLTKYQKEYAKVIARLEELHAGWQELILHRSGMQSYYYIPKPMLKPPEQPILKSTREQRQEFQQRIERIRSEWAFLEAERKSKLDEPRHMVFAHFELVEETLETPEEELERDERAARGEPEPDRDTPFGFRTITEPTPEELWQTVVDLIPRIGRCIADVVYVWKKADVDYQRAQHVARQGAAAFWETESTS